MTNTSSSFGSLSILMFVCVALSLFCFFSPSFPYPSPPSLWLSKAVCVIICMQPQTQQAKQWTWISSASDKWHAGSLWRSDRDPRGPAACTRQPLQLLPDSLSLSCHFILGWHIPTEKKGSTLSEQLFSQISKSGCVMINTHNYDCE